MAKTAKVHILTPYDNPNSFSFLFPIFANKKGLAERGINFRIFTRVNKRLFGCDAIFVDSKFFRQWYWEKEEEVFRLLVKMKKSAGSLLWFDTTDSTGTPQFKLMPYIDGYYKSQILKDTKMYLNNFYGNRLFSDYYNRRFGIQDKAKSPFAAAPLERAYLNKIHIFWNSSLNDHGLLTSNYAVWGNIMSRLRRYSPFELGYTVKFVGVDRQRSSDIAARLGFGHSRNFVAFHRRLLAEKLKKFRVDTRFVNRRLYYRELANAKLSISPFGLGEISYRDFESIICGALLIKPDIAHMATWPDLYKEGETYVKCNWEFSDLEDKIEGLLSDPKRIKDIAKRAQENYGYYLYGRGRTDFCGRLSKILRMR